MASTLYVGLDGWILSDGNYKDFRAGEERKFALEFYGPDLARVIGGRSAPALRHQQSSEYLAQGKVIYSSPEVWVCDFGVLAYREEEPPEWADVGASVEGTIHIGLDPYPYFEYLHKLPGIPKLTYRVFIRRILLDTTPWISDPEGRYAAIRYQSRTSSKEVADTKQGDGTGYGSAWDLDCDIIESGVDPVVGQG